MFVQVFERLARRVVGVAGNRTLDDWRVLTRSAETRTRTSPDLSQRLLPS